MRYHFGPFTLDVTRALLQTSGRDISIEPRGFALLALLVTHHDKTVTKDEIIDAVWDGRSVSDAAISTVIKTTRKAIGDDGVAQKFIRTVRGRGVRFVGPIELSVPADVRRSDIAFTQPALKPPVLKLSTSRPSIAILPFRMVGHSLTYSEIADAISTELISCLSRLRWLTVVSRGSTFRFRENEPDRTAIRAALGVKYCLTGLVEIFGLVIAISVELSDTRSQAVVWSERFSGTVSDVNETRNEIVTHVVSALELHIPLNEAKRARLRPPENLDAWSIYHLGLQHMYRFNKTDNLIAASHFEKATLLDPVFARTYAARSFTSFQSAFLKYNADAAAETDNARRFAERAVELDQIDPFADFTLGRAHWLISDPEAGMPELIARSSLARISRRDSMRMAGETSWRGRALRRCCGFKRLWPLVRWTRSFTQCKAPVVWPICKWEIMKTPCSGPRGGPCAWIAFSYRSHCCDDLQDQRRRRKGHPMSENNEGPKA